MTRSFRKKVAFGLGAVFCFAVALYFLQRPLSVWGAKRLLSEVFPNGAFLNTQNEFKLRPKVEWPRFELLAFAKIQQVQAEEWLGESLGFNLQILEGELWYGTESGLRVEIEKGVLSLGEETLLDQFKATVTGQSLSSFQIRNFTGRAGATTFSFPELAFEEGTCRLEECRMEGPLGQCIGSGDLFLDLPGNELPFCIRSRLSFTGTLAGLSLQTKEPINLAFSPSLGLVASSLLVQLPQGQEVAIEQLELLPSQGICVVRGCHLGSFPQLGLGKLSKEGFIFTLSDEEGELQIKGKWQEALVETVEGNLRGLRCKLQASGLHVLQGSVDIDPAYWAPYVTASWQELFYDRHTPLGLEGVFSLFPLKFSGEVTLR
jgi:hypothetical protein